MSKSKNKVLKTWFACVLFCTPISAFAYVDPGTGGMLLQAILAVVASLIFYLRNPFQLIRDIKFWFSQKDPKDSQK